MDYKRIREIKAKSESLTSRLNLLEEMHKETMEKIDETQNICNHEFIFINKKYENKTFEYLQYGKCLVCGKGITLTPNNVNSDTNELVDEEKIIDVVADEIEKWNFECDCNKNMDELKEAERVFNSLTNDADYLYSRDCIKREIIEAVSDVKKKNLK